MNATEFIKELEQLGYNVEMQKFDRDYNATRHYVNIEGNLVCIEHSFSGRFVDDVSEAERVTLLRIIKSGIKEDKILVAESYDEIERRFIVGKWGGLITSLFWLYSCFVNQDKFYALNNVENYQNLSEFENGFYCTSTCSSIESKARSSFFAQLRLNGIRITETNSIHDMRIFRKLTQKELSQKSGIAQSKISEYENCDDFKNITVGNMRAVAKALDCTIDNLI